jgi:hypothetical protein
MQKMMVHLLMQTRKALKIQENRTVLGADNCIAAGLIYDDVNVLPRYHSFRTRRNVGE